MEEEMKKIGKAGIGVASTIAEKTTETVNKYSKKGEEVLNKRNQQGSYLDQYKDNLSIASLKERMSKLKEEPVNKVMNALDQMTDKAEDAMDTMKDKMEDVMDNVKDKVNNRFQ